MKNTEARKDGESKEGECRQKYGECERRWRGGEFYTDSAFNVYVFEPASATVQRNQSETQDQTIQERYHLNNNHISMVNVKITSPRSSKVHALPNSFIPQTLLRQRRATYTMCYVLQKYS